MKTRKQLETCKHEHTRLFAEWNGYQYQAACLECTACHSVLGMTKKGRKEANAYLAASGPDKYIGNLVSIGPAESEPVAP